MKKNYVIFFLLFIVGCTAPPKEYEIAFEYEDKNAKTVSIAGEFNGWNKHANPMEKREGGLWQTTLKLALGEYEYKFVVDGARWVEDPNANRFKPDHFGGRNSVIIVGSEQEILGYVKRIKVKSLKLTKLEHLVSDDTIFSFVVLGDNRGNAQVYTRFITKIDSLEPNFVVNSGDLITNPGMLNEWEEFVNISSVLNMPYLLTVGNHDVRDEEDENIYRDLFNLPGKEIYYSFDYGNSHFLVLNSEIPNEKRKITGKQYEWLKTDLQTSQKSFKYVFIHRPLYTREDIGHYFRNCLDKFPSARDSLESLFEKYGVDIVFSGHEHLYYKYIHNNVMHITSGGAGAPLYASEENGGFYHFILVKVNGKKVAGEIYKLKDGKFTVLPSFTLN